MVSILLLYAASMPNFKKCSKVVNVAKIWSMQRATPIAKEMRVPIFPDTSHLLGMLGVLSSKK